MLKNARRKTCAFGGTKLLMRFHRITNVDGNSVRNSSFSSMWIEAGARILIRVREIRARWLNAVHYTGKFRETVGVVKQQQKTVMESFGREPANKVHEILCDTNKSNAWLARWKPKAGEPQTSGRERQRERWKKGKLADEMEEKYNLQNKNKCLKQMKEKRTIFTRILLYV